MKNQRFFHIICTCLINFWVAWEAYQFATTKSAYSLGMLVVWGVVFAIWLGVTITDQIYR